MPTYHIWTIGCQMNKAESDRLAGRFEELGYTLTDTAAGADLIVLNSCVVRQSAENRVINKLHALRAVKKTNPDAKIALTGCLVENDTAILKKQFPHIDEFFKAGDAPPWLEEPASSPLPARVKVSELVSISQGCDNFCTYCIVPYRRGRERSKPLDEIVGEVRELVRRGAKEVTLLGQNVDSYGHDLPGQPDLADLLTGLNGTDGLLRLRFLTNHPKDMSDKLIGTIARLDRVCEQINLPIQAGSDEVLRAMRRGYTAEHYLSLINRIKENVPGVALSTDVIVGFPGETDAQFRETLNLLSTVNFATVHVAAYSTREGTVAAREMEDDVPAAGKKERLTAIERLQEEIQTERNARLLGQTVEILVEGRNKGKWYGRTCTDILVFFTGSRDYTGQPVDIRIEKTSPWSLQGTPVSTDTIQEE
ncbi:MAG: MiaB/RimO family radical SAM methylthiotransferase [Dehalococcoidales bacterium]|nr:MiaB/RimO family radical SAM methylthiotransferase [Dehalococcoidales bacterium]